ncbi:hypothetical protein fHeYen902_286 [Yersinia phage fHe-Yen9-02]|nr:hypothetical protein fHeYen902_286 [Yersinia phage fHe-Yen9-02]
MKINEDRRIIVLDSAMFDTLMHYANIGAEEAGNTDVIESIKRHASKFNLAVKQERAKERKEISMDRIEHGRMKKRMMRMLTNRTIVTFDTVDGCPSVRTEHRVFYYLDHTSMTASPIRISWNKSAASRLLVPFRYINTATAERYLGYSSVSHVKNIVETLEEVPESFKVVE